MRKITEEQYKKWVAIYEALPKNRNYNAEFEKEIEIFRSEAKSNLQPS